MKKIFRNLDKPLLFISIVLFIFGLIMIFSASNVTAFMKNSASPYRYFLKQSVFFSASLFVGFIILFFNSKNYIHFSRFFMIVFVGLLAALLIYGSMTNSAKSWYKIGGLAFQPSEFIKIISIVYLASYYDRNKKKLQSFFNIVRPLFLPLIVAILIFLQPDLGTMLIYSFIVIFIYFIVPSSKKIKSRVIIFSTFIFVVAVSVFLYLGKDILQTRQLQRFDYFNPCSEEKFYSTGNQVCNGFIAINNGGFWGRGLGNSIQKYLYLPEAHTDFIFAIIVEELGVAGAILIFILLFLLLGRIIKIGKESYNDRGAIICYAVSFYIFLHIFINLGGIMGIIPMTGVPLPFFSYGGSFTMCLVLALTLVQRVNVENKLFEEFERENKEKR